MNIPPDNPNLQPDEPTWVRQAIAWLRGCRAVAWEFVKVATLLAGSIGGIVAAYRSGVSVKQNETIQKQVDHAAVNAEVAAEKADVAAERADVTAEAQVATLKAIAKQTGDPEASAAVAEVQATTQETK
jgi:hypothetical protein